MRAILYLPLLAATLIISFPQAHATLCFENLPDGGANDLCGLASGNITKTFESFNQPLETQVPGFSLVFLWGGLIGVVWFKTERLDMVGLVGLAVSATITGLSPTATGIGMFLLLVSAGILVFQFLRQRITIFT